MGAYSAEFLLAFLAIMAVIAMLSSSITALSFSMQEKAGAFSAISRAESAARALETLFNSGMDAALDFREEGVQYRIERSRLHAEHGGRTIELGGAFSDDKSEPV